VVVGGSLSTELGRLLPHPVLEAVPYKSHKDRINIHGVFRPSTESGCDEPTRGSYRKTALDASFNALGTEHYLLTENNEAVRDMAGVVPYDAIVIAVNHERHGGGGLYNTYAILTVDHKWVGHLLLHEVGHSLAGLADEYYSSTPTAGLAYFPAGVEPREPNITALLDPANVKWKALATPGVSIPTPWGQDQFDALIEQERFVEASAHLADPALRETLGGRSRAPDTNHPGSIGRYWTV